MKTIFKNLIRSQEICFATLFVFSLVASSCSKILPEAPGKPSDPSYQISLTSGNSQTGTAGNALTSAFVAIVIDASTGQPASGIAVNWSVLSSGGNLNNIYSTSSREGYVSASLTLGSSIGVNTAQVSIKSTPSQLVTFTANSVAGGTSSLHSTIVGSSPVENDGVQTSAITITLRDASNNAIVGTIPTFTASGSNNTQTACSSSDASGVSHCTLASTTAETKILSLTNPTIVGGNVVFAPGAAVAANSSISVAAGPTVANGTSTVLVTIILRDASNVGVGGITPTFSATNTGLGNAYGACAASNASGVSTCTLKSTVAETKTVSLTSPLSITGNSISFVAGPANSANSSISGTTPVEPDGASTSLISIVLQDANHNPIVGVTPSFSATGSTNSYGACTVTAAGTGASTCHLSSTTAEVKTLSLTSPLSLSAGIVTFAASAVSATHSTITSTGPVVANGVAVSNITITLKDASNVAVGGVVPTFTATNTGSGNTYATCSSSNASTGISTCTLASTHAETKTLSLASPITFSGATVVFVAGPISQATSTIMGSGPTLANGATQSTISMQLLDAQNNAISGTTPSFSATDTGSTNVYGTCSSSNASGTSTCTLTSTKAEIKTLSIITPGPVTGNTVSFIAGPAMIANCSITGTGPVSPDGTSTSSISILLKDAFLNPLVGSVPTFGATNSGNTNVYGTCSATNAIGTSTCTLASTHPETKTLSLLTPIAMTGGTVVFAPGAASSTYSTITATGPPTADGSSAATVTITLKDVNNIAIPGVIPTFSATDSGASNIYGSCSASSANGVSTCTFTSTKAEVKTLSIVSPLSMVGGAVTFTSGAVSAANCQISGTGPIAANGVTTSTVTIVLYDIYNNPIAATVPSFSATDSGSNNVYGTCSATTTAGVSSCTLKSTKAEVKTLSIVSPVLHAGGTVSFVATAPVVANSTITGTGPITADGVVTSTITITLKDTNQNPVAGITPTYSATNTGSGNNTGTCTVTNVSGLSTCNLTSTRAELKTLTLLTPVSVTGGTILYNAAPASASTSTITGTGAVNADGTASSSITVTLKDVNSNPVSGTTPTFGATNTGAANIQTACSSSNASGVSTCTLKSTYAEVKTLSILTPVTVTGGTVTFTAVASATNSTISGTSNIVANGVTTSTVTITLKDFSNSALVGVVPTFSATDTGATDGYGICSLSDASGNSTCTLKSTKAEVKTLSLLTPVSKAGGTVTFIAGAAASTSTISGTGPVIANGTATSTVSIVLLDAFNNFISGTVPTFYATDPGTTNVYGACSSSDAIGASSCTLKSLASGTKTVSLVSPVAKTGNTVVFTQLASSTYSTIAGSGPVGADGSTTSTITIKLKDYNNTAIVGTTPTFTATNTGSSNVYGACTSSNGSGTSTCTLKSTNAETKTLTLSTPISFTGGTVVFTQMASAANTTITATGGNSIGTQTNVTITIKDYANVGMAGIVPTYTATNGPGTATYTACTSSNASGSSSCSFSGNRSGNWQVNLAIPVSGPTAIVNYPF